MAKKKAPATKKKTTKPSVRTLARVQQAARQAAFLKHYTAGGVIGPAARAAGISRDTHYEWFASDQSYVARFNEATKMRVEVLEQEARRRGLVGWDEPVYYKGRPVGSIRKFSDTLLIFALKAEMPEKYRERYEHTGPGGGPIVSRVVFGGRYKPPTDGNPGDASGAAPA